MEDGSKDCPRWTAGGVCGESKTSVGRRESGEQGDWEQQEGAQASVGPGKELGLWPTSLE